MTPHEAAWKRARGAGALRERWLGHDDLRDPLRRRPRSPRAEPGEPAAGAGGRVRVRGLGPAVAGDRSANGGVRGRQAEAATGRVIVLDAGTGQEDRGAL